jgi:hypothetical protein
VRSLLGAPDEIETPSDLTTDNWMYKLRTINPETGQTDAAVRVYFHRDTASSISFPNK